MLQVAGYKLQVTGYKFQAIGFLLLQPETCKYSGHALICSGCNKPVNPVTQECCYQPLPLL